jgi:hypothetical protein
MRSLVQFMIQCHRRPFDFRSVLRHILLIQRTNIAVDEKRVILSLSLSLSLCFSHNTLASSKHTSQEYFYFPSKKALALS